MDIICTSQILISLNSNTEYGTVMMYLPVKTAEISPSAHHRKRFSRYRILAVISDQSILNLCNSIHSSLAH